MIMVIPSEELTIRRLGRTDFLNTFDSGNKDLNDYLKNDSLNSQSNLLARTYICFHKNKSEEIEELAGFITLVADTLEVKVVDEIDGVEGYPYKKYPAIKIARLAIDKKFQHNGIGTFLLSWAAGKAYQSSQHIGCRYITVDSKPESKEFYEKCGFKLVKKYANKKFPPMYLNMFSITSAMKGHESLEGFLNGSDP